VRIVTQILIRCPSCKKSGKIAISEDLIKSTSRGLLAVNIAAGIICPDSFIAYIDKNYSVRDYFIADFQIEIPDLPEERVKIKRVSLPDKNVLNLDLIKLNFTITMLSSILRAILMKKEIILISHQSFLNDHTKNFFHYITKDSFQFDYSNLPRQKTRQPKYRLLYP